MSQTDDASAGRRRSLTTEVTAPARLIAALVVHEAALDDFERTRAAREAAAEEARRLREADGRAARALREAEARAQRRSRLRYGIIGASLTLSALAGHGLRAVERSDAGASPDAGEVGPLALLILAIVGGGVAYAWLGISYEPSSGGVRIATFIGRACYCTLAFWPLGILGFGIGYALGS